MRTMILKRFLRGLLILGSLSALPAAQAVTLADQPVFSTTSVPGNLALVLSVEYPTALAPAYLSTTTYTPSSTFIGYFDSEKCYRYVYNSTTVASSYFTPYGAASTHACTSTSTYPLWSGNWLNYAAMQGLDSFRWVLTGGTRSVDTTSQTILEKTYNSGQGSSTNTANKSLASTYVSGATPFSWASSVTTADWGLGITMKLYSATALTTCGTMKTKNSKSGSTYTSVDTYSCTTTAATTVTCTITTSSTSTSTSTGAATTCTTSAALQCTRSVSGTTYTYSCTGLDANSAVTGAAITGTSTFTSLTTSGTFSASGITSATTADYNAQSSAGSTQNAATYYTLYIRVKVCDSSVGKESNCVAYTGATSGSTNYKPEGLMQSYASKLRYAAFGYLNNWATSFDGGVLRERMKYIGPTQPVPGSTSITNTAAEWDSTYGIMVQNPNSSDASTTSTASGVTISYSGVMNYLNWFGKLVTDKGYKKYDPTSELYYAATRYYRNLGNVSAYSSFTLPDTSTSTTQLLDGFPVITTWDDPIAYYCQKNFILGIGDVDTNYDGDLYGTSVSTGGTTPTDDTTVNVTTATNMVGQLEGLSVNLGTKHNTSASSSGTVNADYGGAGTFYIAGLAYDAHTKDIRSDLTDTQTINTYWLDVMEYEVYVPKNQYWYAAKYGGFTVPSGFSPYATTNSSSTLTNAAWWTSGDYIDTANTYQRPDNYFVANEADTMKSSLTSAFNKIVSESAAATSTALASPSPVQALSGNANYVSSYDPSSWTGYVKGQTVTYDSSGNPTYTDVWNARTILSSTSASSRIIVTCCTSTGTALPFTYSSLSSATLSSRTYFASFSTVPGVTTASQSAANYVSYLRGDTTKEVANGGAYRTRSYLLGDIVDSGVTAVGVPSQSYWDLYNPGYSSFVKTYASRNTVVYVGANDGMMHAFDGSVSTTSSTAGSELFAYVPSFVYGDSSTATTSGLAALGNPTFTHYYKVNGTPTSADVDFYKTSSPTATTNDWRTILVGGLGKGGTGYYAIDITNPTDWTSDTAVAGKVLWEYTNTHMGYTYGDPLIIKTAKYGWVVVLTSGYSNDTGKGYFFFINPRTGALLETVATSTGSTSAPVNLAYASAFVPSYYNGTADAIYAGDLQGNVWRLDITGTSGSYSAPTAIATLTNAASTAEPVTTRPLIEADADTGKRYVMVGTGQLLSDSDITSTSRQSFYSIIDGTATSGGFYTSTTLPTGISFPVTRSNLEANTDLTAGISTSPTNVMGWYYDLPASYSVTSGSTTTTYYAARVTVQPTFNDNIVAFAETIPTGSACDPSGISTIHALSLTTGVSVLTNSSGTIISGISTTSAVRNLSFYSVNGIVRLLAGDSSGTITNVSGSYSSSGTVKRLNWRTVPTTE